MSAARSEEVIITNRGGSRPVRVEVADWACSWAVNDTNTFSFLVPAEKLNRFGITDYLTKWVFWDHPELGTFGGVITADPVSHGSRSVEIAGEGFTRLLKKRRTPRRYEQETAPPGALAIRAIRDVSGEDYTFIREWYADEDGDPIEYEWRGEDLHSVTSTFASQGNMEFDIDSDRVYQMRTRLGRDISASVQLMEYVNFALDRRARDDTTLINNRLGVSADERFTKQATGLYLDVDSIQRWGTQEDTVAYPGMATGAAILPRVRSDVLALRTPLGAISGTVLNRWGDWSSFREGDSLRFVLPTANAIVRARIMTRAYRGGVLTIAADIEEVL